MKAQDVEACRGARHMMLLGQRICNRGFMKALGVGKQRFKRMRSAHMNNETYCPFDMRFKPPEQKLPSEARQAVFHFLMTLWQEVAEHIPDGLNSQKRPRQGAHRFDPQGMDRSKLKHLPHASLSDYHEQCRSQNPHLQIGKKLFDSVSYYKFSLFRMLCVTVISHFD